MRPITTIYINGKFAAQRLTGVQRFAIEITRALDELEEITPKRFVLLVPNGAQHLGLANIEQREVAGPGTSLHAWEQVALPWAARRGLILNLTGSAAITHARQIASIHDVAVFEHPDAYSRLFVAWYRWSTARQARRAKAIITVSDYSRTAISKLFRPPAAIAVISNAADQIDDVDRDETIIERLGLQGSNYLLAVGSNNPTKNFSRLVAAFRQAEFADPVKLVIVGADNLNVFALNRAIEEDERVVRAGHVSDSELKALYASARAFVFPSIYEGFGLPPLEAMACGCAVAASTAGAIPEVCGNAALYFDPFDVGAIGTALVTINTDAPLRNRLIDAGYSRVEQFSWEASARKLLECVNSAVLPSAGR